MLLLLVVFLLATMAQARIDYTGHQVLKIGTMSPQLVNYLSARGDFWELPFSNGSGPASLCVGPRHATDVVRLLKQQGVSVEVWINDVEREILRERQENEVEQGGKTRADRRSDQRQRGGRRKPRLSKRETLLEMLMGAVVGGTGGSRRPRKIETGGSNLQQEARGPGIKVKNAVGMDWSHYHRLVTIYSWMEQLAARFPHLVSLKVIGKTSEGQNMVVVTVGHHGGNNNRPGIFIEGGIHAREWISPAVVTYMIEKLVTDERNRDLVDYYNFYFLPVTNPDGYEFTHTEDRMWRKNRAKTPSLLNILGNCRGVDLNRNFGYKWGEAFDLLDPAGKGGTPLPCLETFHGGEAFSEQESQAVRNFVLSLKNSTVAYLAYHSYGEKIIYPWSHTDEKVEDWEELHHMANSLAKGAFIDSLGRDYYKIGTAADIQYAASGGSDDWARGVAGIKWVYLIELPGRGHGFLLPPHHIDQVARSSFAGLREFLTELPSKLPR